MTGMLVKTTRFVAIYLNPNFFKPMLNNWVCLWILLEICFNLFGPWYITYAAEIIANKGSKLEIITPERFFSPEVGGMNYVPYAKTFIEKNVKITIDKRIKRIKKRGNRLLVSIGSDYSNILENLETSQVIIEHGTLPLDDLYFELKQKSYNLGAIDYNSLI